MTQADIPFEVEAAVVEELSGPEWTARELCALNAESKAREVAARFPDRLVLGADTVVAFEGKVFGKPIDLSEARWMLESLCGHVHEVLTGVCIYQQRSNRLCRFVESTRVKFKPLEEVDIDAYLASVHSLDKAGAYAAQEDEGRLIECIEGLLSNVVGLPVERVRAALDEHFPGELNR